MAEDTKASHLRRLEERKQKKTEHRRRVLSNIFALRAMLIVMTVIFVLIVLWAFWKETHFLRILYLNFFSIIFAVLFALLLMARAAKTEIEQELDSIEFEVDLLQLAVNSREMRAEKVFQINEVQLRRYYNLNLKQNIWLFMLGIVCTMYIIIVIQSDIDTKIITAVIGSIGSLLSSYVAAIYLKMHASAAAHLGSFHPRLNAVHLRGQEHNRLWPNVT